MRKRNTRKIRGGAVAAPRVPVGADNVVFMEEIKAGDEMAAWIQDNGKYTWDFGKYYKKSTYDGLPVPKRDPTTRKPITNPIFYRAELNRPEKKAMVVKNDDRSIREFMRDNKIHTMRFREDNIIKIRQWAAENNIELRIIEARVPAKKTPKNGAKTALVALLAAAQNRRFLKTLKKL